MVAENPAQPPGAEPRPDSRKKAASPIAGQRRMEWLLLFVLAAVQFTSIVDFMVVMPLGPQLRRKLGIEPAQFGWIVASYTLAAGLAGLLASSVLDRFGRRAAYLSLFTGFLAGTLLCGLSFNYTTLLAARVVTGAFGGHPGRHGPGDHRRRLPGRAAGPRHRDPDVGIRAGVGPGRAPVPVARDPLRLACPLPRPGRLRAGGARALRGRGLCLHSGITSRSHAHAHPWTRLCETFSDANQLQAFALTFAIMFGGFSVIPYISLYLVSNVGVSEHGSDLGLCRRRAA